MGQAHEIERPRNPRDLSPDVDNIHRSIYLAGSCFGVGGSEEEATDRRHHGSTFGGNPLACAVARTALRVLREEKMVENAAAMGAYFLEKLKGMKSPFIKEVRGKGLLIGVELYPQAGGARRLCELLKERGLLCKETHLNVIRFAPPLIIRKGEIDWALERIDDALTRA